MKIRRKLIYFFKNFNKKKTSPLAKILQTTKNSTVKYIFLKIIC